MDEIKSIDSLRVDGNFVTADNTVPEGNDDICQLLEYARKWADLIWEQYVVCLSVLLDKNERTRRRPPMLTRRP
jgi:hypothetical protein